MGHPHLSAGLSAFIETAKKNNGFYIEHLAENMVVELVTEQGTWHFVVIDPARAMVAMVGTPERFEHPDIFLLAGSTFGGSAIKVGWIGIALYPEFRRIDGAWVRLPKLLRFVLSNDEVQAKDIRTRAEEKREETLSGDPEGKVRAWEHEFAEKIAKDFAGEHLEEVQKLLTSFCTHGKAYTASFLHAAKEAGKLTEGLAVMYRRFRTHWAYKAPEIRGDLVSASDVREWEDSYKELDLSLPDDS